MLASLAVELQAAGAKSLVIAPAGGEGWLARELAGTGVELEFFRLERALSPEFARWLATTLRRHRVALAHSHEFTMAVYGAWAARWAGVPHLFTMHGSRYYAGRWRRRLALRLSAALSGAVVAVSESLAQHLRRDLWLRARRIVTIPNGARLSPARGTSLREELALGPAERVVVALGNLYPVKGHADLVEAQALLATRFPRLHVAIAGRGELEGTLLARARALGVDDRFHLLGLRSDVANVLAGADIFALPSLSEGIPLALLEAMLAGRPIVATAVGGVPAVLCGGQAGLLVPPGEPVALAAALGRLLDDGAEARRLGAAAALRATQEYGVETMLERYTTLYAALLARGRGPSRLSPTHLTNPLLEARQIAAVETAVGGQCAQSGGEEPTAREGGGLIDAARGKGREVDQGLGVARHDAEPARGGGGRRAAGPR